MADLASGMTKENLHPELEAGCPKSPRCREGPEAVTSLKERGLGIPYASASSICGSAHSLPSRTVLKLSFEGCVLVAGYDEDVLPFERNVISELSKRTTHLLFTLLPRRGLLLPRRGLLGNLASGV